MRVATAVGRVESDIGVAAGSGNSRWASVGSAVVFAGVSVAVAVGVGRTGFGSERSHSSSALVGFGKVAEAAATAPAARCSCVPSLVWTALAGPGGFDTEIAGVERVGSDIAAVEVVSLAAVALKPHMDSREKMSAIVRLLRTGSPDCSD